MDRLKDKVAGLPVGVWGLLVGLVVVGYMYWSRSKAASVNASAGPVATGALVYPDVAGTGLPPAASSDTTSNYSGDGFQTNGTWEANAALKLIGQGESPLAVQAALDNYLNGVAMTPAQQALVNRAIQITGMLPPQGVTPASSVAPIAQVPLYKFDPSNKTTIRNAANGAVYQVQAGGLYHLAPTELAILGNPKPVTTYSTGTKATGAGARYQPYNTVVTPTGTK